MAKYLITYHGGTPPSDPAAMTQVKAAFAKWLGEAGSAVIDPGAPVRMVAQVANGTPAPSADIGGYSIVEAASADEVISLLKRHPFVARGGTLQVSEAVSI